MYTQFVTFDRLLTLDLLWILILAGFLQVCAQVHKAFVTRGSSSLAWGDLSCGRCFHRQKVPHAFVSRQIKDTVGFRSFQQIFDLIFLIGIEYKDIIQIYITLWFALNTSFSFSFTVV